ncbi:hypothetical protein ACT7C9_32005 [Bacillus cereus]
MGLITFSAIMIIADLMIISDDDYRKLRRGWIKMKTAMGLKIHSFCKKNWTNERHSHAGNYSFL